MPSSMMERSSGTGRFILSPGPLQPHVCVTNVTFWRSEGSKATVTGCLVNRFGLKDYTSWLQCSFFAFFPQMLRNLFVSTKCKLIELPGVVIQRLPAFVKSRSQVFVFPWIDQCLHWPVLVTVADSWYIFRTIFYAVFWPFHQHQKQCVGPFTLFTLIFAVYLALLHWNKSNIQTKVNSLENTHINHSLVTILYLLRSLYHTWQKFYHA